MEDLEILEYGVGERTNDVTLASGYYSAKLPDRRAQMETIIAPALAFQLDTIDRFENSDQRFVWPEKYLPHIWGRLSYQETVDVYRRYKVALNVNSVTTSTTMCSRRIFELLACGAYIVSGPSAALGAYVPEELVQVASTADDARQLIEQGLTSRSMLENAAVLGPKWIAAGQTYADRVNYILGVVNG